MGKTIQPSADRYYLRLILICCRVNPILVGSSHYVLLLWTLLPIAHNVLFTPGRGGAAVTHGAAGSCHSLLEAVWSAWMGLQYCMHLSVIVVCCVCEP